MASTDHHHHHRTLDDLIEKYGIKNLFSKTKHPADDVLWKDRRTKWMLLALNVLFLIFGSVLVSVGSTTNSMVDKLANSTLANGIVVIGAFIVTISFIGGVATFRESRVLLGGYFVVILVLTIILLIVGIVVYAAREQALIYIGKGFIDATPAIRTDIQNTFSCCGLNAIDDMYAIEPCPSDAKSGCLNTLDGIFQSTYYQAGACGIAFAVVMGFALGLVYIFMQAIKHKQRVIELQNRHLHLREQKEQEIDITIDAPNYGVSAFEAKKRADLVTAANAMKHPPIKLEPEPVQSYYKNSSTSTSSLPVQNASGLEQSKIAQSSKHVDAAASHSNDDSDDNHAEHQPKQKIKQSSRKRENRYKHNNDSDSANDENPFSKYHNQEAPQAPPKTMQGSKKAISKPRSSEDNDDESNHIKLETVRAPPKGKSRSTSSKTARRFQHDDGSD